MDAQLVETVSSVHAEDETAALVRSRLLIASLLSAIAIAIYFGFMVLFAFDKPLLGSILAPGLSLCILMGPLVIIGSFVLCLVYVCWANAIYDPGVESLKRSGQ